MAKRRELTPEERTEAERLSAAWLAYKGNNKGANQTWLAAASGLGTQGAVGQYLRAVIPLNLEALLSICAILEIDPRRISPRLMEKVADVQEFWRPSATPAQPITIQKNSTGWPFSISIDLFFEMPMTERERLDDYVIYTLKKWHAEHPGKHRKSS